MPQQAASRSRRLGQRAWLGNKQVHGAWWYDGEIDLGFSGALRAAATVVSDDPLFGLIAYGGDLKRTGASVAVVPKDGLRTRFYIVRGGVCSEMTLDPWRFLPGTRRWFLTMP